MKSTQLIKLVLSLVVTLAMIAPFTFLKEDIVATTVELPSTTLLEPLGKEIALKVKPLATMAPRTKSKPVVKKLPENPLHQMTLPDFAAISDTKQKKKHFFNYMKPAVNKQNQHLLAQRAKLLQWLDKINQKHTLTKQEQQALAQLTSKYKVKKHASVLVQLHELLLRVDIVPMPLVLVQAANESAWGTSRFSRIGLNFFGIWCYTPGCGMVPNGRTEGDKHEVAAFKSLDDAVAHYLYNINSNKAYRVFRTIRAELREQGHELSAEILATGLLPYSERGADYVIEITNMLRHNRQYLTENNDRQPIIVAE